MRHYGTTTAVATIAKSSCVVADAVPSFVTYDPVALSASGIIPPAVGETRYDVPTTIVVPTRIIAPPVAINP
jgi:hypothetical protein